MFVVMHPEMSISTLPEISASLPPVILAGLSPRSFRAISKRIRSDTSLGFFPLVKSPEILVGIPTGCFFRNF